MPLSSPSLVSRLWLRSPGTRREFHATCWSVAKLFFLYRLLHPTCCLNLCLQTLAPWDSDGFSSPPWITPRDGHNCSRMLMNLPIVFVYLSSRCALGDRLPLFFRMDCLTFVGPTVCSGTWTSLRHNPISDCCVQVQSWLFQMSSPPSTFWLAFHCCRTEETHVFP